MIYGDIIEIYLEITHPQGLLSGKTTLANKSSLVDLREFLRPKIELFDSEMKEFAESLGLKVEEGTVDTRNVPKDILQKLTDKREELKKEDITINISDFRFNMESLLSMELGVTPVTFIKYFVAKK